MIQCSLWQVPAQIDRQGRMDGQFNRENKTNAATITTAPEANRKPLVSPRNFCNFSGVPLHSFWLSSPSGSRLFAHALFNTNTKAKPPATGAPIQKNSVVVVQSAHGQRHYHADGDRNFPADPGVEHEVHWPLPCLAIRWMGRSHRRESGAVEI